MLLSASRLKSSRKRFENCAGRATGTHYEFGYIRRAGKVVFADIYLGETDNWVINEYKLEAIVCMTEIWNYIAELAFGWTVRMRLSTLGPYVKKKPPKASHKKPSQIYQLLYSHPIDLDIAERWSPNSAGDRKIQLIPSLPINSRYSSLRPLLKCHSKLALVQ
jgi:hypothetical protein